MITDTARLTLIKDIADNEFNNQHGVVLLNCSHYPIITNDTINYSMDNVYPDVKSFMQNRLKINNESLDRLTTELGFTNGQVAMNFIYTAIKNQQESAIYTLLAKAYGAVYLKDIYKIALLTSAKSLDDIAALAKLVKKRDPRALDQANGLLLYLGYRVNINRPITYSAALHLLRKK